MHSKVWGKYEQLCSLAQSDQQYCQMMQDMRDIERNYQVLLSELPTEKQNIVCDFVSQCEEMSFRMLELALTLAEKTPPE